MYLTACYITKNESRNLSASLATVAPIADRIVVVDTGSTDDTVEIARRCGAEVLSFPWQDDFAAARNFALDHAAPSETPEDSDRWILFLDADESLPHAEGLREMLAGLSAASPAPEGVLLTLVNVDDDAEGLEISRFHALRLWRQRPHYRYRGAIHEMLVDTRTGRPPEPCAIDQRFLVRHTGYSSARVRSKLLRDLAMLEADMQAHGEQPLTMRYLADACYGLGRYEDAVRAARKALAAPVTTVAGDRDLYDVLLRSLQKLGRPLTEQQDVVHEALAHLTGTARAEFVGWQGRLRLAAGDAAGAHDALAECLNALQDKAKREGEAGSSGAEAGLPDILAADAQALFSLGRQKEAEKQAMTALASNPYQEKALAVLAECFPDAEAMVSRVLPLYPAPEKGASFLASFAERHRIVPLRTTLAAHLSLEEREGRAAVTACFEQAAAGDWDSLVQSASTLAGEALQELFSALVALPEERRAAEPDRVAEWEAALPAALRHLLFCMRAQQAADAQEEATFFTGLEALSGFVTEQQVLPYVRLSESFGPAALLRTAHWLADRCMEAAAWELLQRIPADFLAEDAQAADFWLLTGRVLWTLGAEGAQECFERATAAGCEDPRLAFHLHWARKEQEA